MADAPQGLLPFDRERLEGLPQTFDVWELGTRRLDATVRSGGQSVRPWVTGAYSNTEDVILALEVTNEPPTAAQAWQVLLQAIQQPEAGEPHRPTEVRLARQPAWEASLRPSLEALNVGCATVAALDGLDPLLAELSDGLTAPASTALLDMPGVTPEAVASLFDAAALFYRQAPWTRTGERPIRIECPRFESSPWYGVVMGQGGMTRGLVLYDDLATLLRIQQGGLADEEGARQTAALAVVFGARDELAPKDAATADAQGWAVAGPEAYPSVYRMEPGLSVRSPLAWELHLLEGCLRAVQEFARKKTRRVAPLSLTVPTAGGELPLVLAWAAD